MIGIKDFLMNMWQVLHQYIYIYMLAQCEQMENSVTGDRNLHRMPVHWKDLEQVIPTTIRFPEHQQLNYRTRVHVGNETKKRIK